MCHRCGKVRLPQELFEAQDVRRLVADAKLPEAVDRGEIRFGEEGHVGLQLAPVDGLRRNGDKFVLLQINCVHMVLREAVLVAVLAHERGARIIQTDEPGVIVRLAVHGAGAHAEHQTQHALVFRAGVVPADVEVFRMADARDVRVVILAVAVAGDAHDEQRHLLVAVEQVAVGAVLDGVDVHGAGVHGAHGLLEHGVALLQGTLVCTEHAVVFAGERVAEAVLQQGAGAHDDRRLAEVFEHGEKLLLDARRERAVQQLLLDLRRDLQIVAHLVHLGAQSPAVVVDKVGVKHVRADVIGVVRLDALFKEFGVGIAQDVARQQHAGGLAADAAGADLPVFDVDEILDGEVAAAQLQPLRLDAEQALENVVDLRIVLVPGHDGVEHLVPAVALLADLHEFLKDGVGVHAGGQRRALVAAQADGKVHRLRAPAVDVDGMDVQRAVHRAHVQQYGRGVADVGDRVVRVAFVHDGEVADGFHLRQIRIGQTEKVADHPVGKPELLQLGQAVEDVKDALALLPDDAVDGDGEALKADVRVQLVLLRVCAGGCQRIRIHDLHVLAEAEVHNALAGARDVHHKAVGDVNIIGQTVDLPDDVVPGTQAVERMVKPFDAGADFRGFAHNDAPLLPKLVFLRFCFQNTPKPDASQELLCLQQKKFSEWN